MFTICLCISPDLDGYKGTKNETLTPQDPQQVPIRYDMCVSRVCFTICLCISPDLDGYQGNKNETFATWTPICFTICLCISPDLDGNRGTTKNVPRETRIL
jgi:hypothetical protein